MTTAERHLQTFARQQLGHVPVESSELYIRTDTTTATRCTEALDRVVVRRLEHLPVDATELYINAARPDDEVTP